MAPCFIFFKKSSIKVPMWSREKKFLEPCCDESVANLPKSLVIFVNVSDINIKKTVRKQCYIAMGCFCESSGSLAFLNSFTLPPRM